MSPKVILVTGASSGFGRALVEQILADGNIAVAGLRTVSAIQDLASLERILVLPLDITNSEQREAAFKSIKEKYGRLDVLVNNAGVVGDVGEVESVTEDRYRACFDVNVWGTLEMTKLAVQLFRDTTPQGGRIINISSFVGYACPPGCAVYNASKQALESLMSTFAAELDPEWNIKFTLVQPGQFATSAINSSLKHDPHPAYTKPELPVHFVRNYVLGDVYKDAPGKDPKEAAKVILKVAGMENPPPRQAIGSDSVNAIIEGSKLVISQIEETQDLAKEADMKA
ncbi:NAD-P-binding protein [Meredithblackwellia eburnea MCA 4105]